MITTTFVTFCELYMYPYKKALINNYNMQILWCNCKEIRSLTLEVFIFLHFLYNHFEPLECLFTSSSTLAVNIFFWLIDSNISVAIGFPCKKYRGNIFLYAFYAFKNILICSQCDVRNSELSSIHFYLIIFCIKPTNVWSDLVDLIC